MASAASVLRVNVARLMYDTMEEEVLKAIADVNKATHALQDPATKRLRDARESLQNNAANKRMRLLHDESDAVHCAPVPDVDLSLVPVEKTAQVVETPADGVETPVAPGTSLPPADDGVATTPETSG